MTLKDRGDSARVTSPSAAR